MPPVDSLRVLYVTALLFAAFIVGLFVLAFIGRLLSKPTRKLFPSKTIPHENTRL